MADDMFLRITGMNNQIESNATQMAEPATTPTPAPSGFADMASSLEQAPESNLFSEAFGPLNTPGVEYDQAGIEMTPGFQELLAPTEPAAGKVNWDSILQLKQEMMKENPDWQSVFQSLQNLSVPDRIATLSEMQKEGDLSAFIQKLPPEAHQALADFLVPLVSAQGPDGDPQLQKVLSGIFADMNDGTGKFADTVRAMCSKSSPTQNFQEANSLVEILHSDPAPEHRLSNLLMRSSTRRLSSRNPHLTICSVPRILSQ
jgi:hypothetical protein